MVLHDSAVPSQQSLIAVLRPFSVWSRPCTIAVFQLRQIGNRIPNCHEGQQAWAMCLFGELDCRIGSRGHAKHAPAILWHPLFFGAEYLPIARIADAFHTPEYLLPNPAHTDLRNADYLRTHQHPN